ncbi:hypothetical protein AAFF_G00348170 [Aldrovandia affinis]|uniref:Box C/D snoRNA protein 1 n=1 Tax=Aldrovandia affinis TaxID=143900 RepID=A0AAD7VZR4_9TELE|nr:hypothetical protein AAFF_G00348170 [Aldrovandia affinis]
MMESLIVPESQCNDSVEEVKKRKISLENCGTCGTGEAKYRCPRCLKRSCSLSCVKKHKSESGCSGVRDKTAFVPVSKFDEFNLLSDYRFLEDTSRLADSAQRDPCILRPQTPKYAKVLRQQAFRLNLQLKLLPPGFSKRRENSTFYHKKQGLFFWHLKLLFPQSSAEYTERRVADNQTLQQILAPYIHPTESEPVRRQRLKVYTHAPPHHVKVFMKAENRRSNAVRYHELDLQKTLRDNLRFKVVIEYPVIHIVLQNQCENYALLSQESRAGPGVSVATRPVLPSDKGKDEPSNARVIRTAPSGGGNNGDDDDEEEEGEIRDEEDAREG